MVVEVSLEKFCRRPSNIRLLLAMPEGGVKQDDIYRRGPIPAGAFYGALKELLAYGLVERRMNGGIYYLYLTEKGKEVKRLLERLAELLE